MAVRRALHRASVAYTRFLGRRATCRPCRVSANRGAGPLSEVDSVGRSMVVSIEKSMRHNFCTASLSPSCSQKGRPGLVPRRIACCQACAGLLTSSSQLATWKTWAHLWILSLRVLTVSSPLQVRWWTQLYWVGWHGRSQVRLRAYVLISDAGASPGFTSFSVAVA